MSDRAGGGAAAAASASAATAAAGEADAVGSPQRGRPRSHRAHQAILAAASDLLLNRGLSAVSMDAVAERAGVSKATIYRWWPTKWARLVSSRPYGAVIAQLIAAAQADPGFAEENRRRFVEPRRELARAALQRAKERGEGPSDIRVEVALDLIYGPIYHRLLHGHGVVNDRFVTDAIDMALNGIRGRSRDESRG